MTNGFSKVALAGATLTIVAGCASSNKPVELGYELVAVSAPAGSIRVAEVFPMRAGAWSWNVSLGDEAGLWIERRRAATDEYDAAWVQTEGDGRREYWTHDADGNLVMTAVAEPADQALTFFDPPMIIAYSELTPGRPREQQVNMRVMDLVRPDRLKDRGTATRTMRYVDDRLIRTPLGTMPTRRIEVTFRADLGLARAENATTLLVYPSFGVVVEKREDRVTVVGVQFRHRDQTLVLRKLPK